ncbi:MAG: hypothetical protein Q7R85_03660 [bacterium]|nr:hypothetical protein [bacterium]
MSRRKNRGDATPVPLLFGMLIVGAVVAVVGIVYFAWQDRAKINAQPAVTTPAPTQSDTQPEATKPKEDPKPKEKPKGDTAELPPDGAPSNPLFLAWRELENGMSSGDAEAVVKKYGDYANLGDPFISHAKAGDTYIWKWESRNKEWRTRLQYSIMRSGTTLGIFYTQEHVDYTKTMAK